VETAPAQQTSKPRGAQSDPELRAIETMLRALEPVPEDRRAAVLSFVSGKLGIGPSQPPGTVQLPRTIEEFMAQRNPVNHYQRVAALAYYLDGSKGIREVDTGVIVDANRQAGGPKLGNAAQVIADAERRYGFFSPSTERGKKRLTLRAKRVVEALPNQEGVRRVLEQIPFRSRKAAKVRAKKKPA